MNLKITSTMMTMMFLLSALAGCTGGDEAVDLDDSDGGYDTPLTSTITEC